MEAGEWESEQSQELSSDLDRIEMSKGQLAEDNEWVAKESDKVEALIVSQTGPDQKELEKLLGERESVQVNTDPYTDPYLTVCPLGQWLFRGVINASTELFNRWHTDPYTGPYTGI